MVAVWRPNDEIWLVDRKCLLFVSLYRVFFLPFPFLSLVSRQRQSFSLKEQWNISSFSTLHLLSLVFILYQVNQFWLMIGFIVRCCLFSCFYQMLRVQRARSKMPRSISKWYDFSERLFTSWHGQCHHVSKIYVGKYAFVDNYYLIETNDNSSLVGDGIRYYMRGCAVRGRVSRKQGRDCIERLGKSKFNDFSMPIIQYESV